MSKPKFPVTVKRGHTIVKIYRTPSRGCDAYTVSYYLGDQRVRKTFADYGLATTEAETVANKLSTGEVNVLTLTSGDRLATAINQHPPQSTTDPDSVLYRKANGQAARLCFGAHALMENRNGLCADLTLHNPIAESEPVVALQQADAHEQLHEGVTIQTLGADKNYHQQGFVQGCRERAIAPHVACKDKVNVAGLDGRTTPRQSYQVSLKIRKRVEEILGWIKTVGGFRRSRYRGLERTQAWGYFVAGTYNLLRMARLAAG